MRNNIVSSIISSQYFAGFFSVYPALPNNAERFGASVGNAQYKGQKNMDLVAAFRLIGRTMPIHFALLGRKRKYIKSKTTAK
jgi:hypothetical protein